MLLVCGDYIPNDFLRNRNQLRLLLDINTEITITTYLNDTYNRSK